MSRTSFPNAIQKDPAKGVQGDKATLNPCVYTDRNYLAGDEAVTVGNFVWVDPDNLAPEDYHGSGALLAVSEGSAGVLPVGLVERNLSYVNPDLFSTATLVVPKFAALNTIVRGDVYVVSATAAIGGQKVFAVLADGSIKTDATGATVAGAVETNWSVTEGGAAGAIITISNWSA